MSDKSKLDLGAVLQEVNDFNQIQQIKSIGSQRRAASTSPNAITANGAPSPNTPKHVTNVHATLSRTSDVSSKVTVTFQQDPTDYYFSNAQVYVSGYKGNPAPVLVGSGQSPISFPLENSGDAVAITVQSVGSLGPAPLASAPTTTLKLDKTALVTVATPAGNGTGGGGGGSSVTAAPFMYSAGIFSFPPLMPGGGLTFVDVAFRVCYCRFVTPFSLNLKHIDGTMRTGAASANIGYAIYDSNGNLVWQSGAFLLTNSASPQNISFTAASALNIQPGTYFLAWSSDSNFCSTSGVDLSPMSFLSGTSDGNIINQGPIPTFGRCANPATNAGGLTFPATMGALTPFSAVDSYHLPAVFFRT